MKQSLLIITLAVASAAMAQSTLDLQSRAELRRANLNIGPGIESPEKTGVKKSAPALSRSHVFGFVKISADADIDVLLEKGVEIQRRAGNILLASIPADVLDDVASSPGVKRVQLSRDLAPKLDFARASTGVDKIHSGTELPQAYTGKGVVVGIVDGGMDPNHINFKDADGNCRIGQLTHIRLNEAGTTPLTSTYTAAQMPMFTTDDATAYHGTHTMGIMAGSHRAKANVAHQQGGAGNVAISELPNPYYGVAYEAEIAASCGQLQDYFIAQGVSGILDYAYAQRKPSVVNLSLGSNLGPHDGKGLMSQYLQAEAEQNGAIFCISAGNEGDLPIALNRTFTDEETTVQTFIKPNYYGPAEKNIRYGSLNIYSADESTFDVRAVVYNRSRGRVALNIPISGNTGGQALYYVSDAGYVMGENDVVSANFAKAFEGYVGLGSMIDEDSGRFYAIVDYMTFDNQTTNADGNYLLGIIVSGKPGQRIDMFCDGFYTEFSGYGEQGWADGSFNGTISDLATTKSAVIVGAYDNRDSWCSLDGNQYGYDGTFVPGTISEFSSFGETVDGRRLPHICAPGATIISSTSTHFVTNYENGITPAYLHAWASNGDREDYWEQMAGTSMASPLVAGSIALWLQADPTLRIDDILDIIGKTATVDADVLTTGDPVQWGAGKFNAYEGLKEVLRRSGIYNVKAEEGAPVVSNAGGRLFKVFADGATEIRARIYDMSGRLAVSTSAHSDELTLDLSQLLPGIYVAEINGTAHKLNVK